MESHPIPLKIDNEGEIKDTKTIICCFDGTGNQFGENSNIVRLVDMLSKNSHDQIVYYQPGIGTYSQRQYYTAIAANLFSKFNEAVASSFSDHVKQGYMFIMQNYRHGDRICLFGFSRGAYVVRVLMGMIYKVGLLPPNNIEQVNLAYTMYEATDEKGYRLSQRFKKTYSTHVTIEFVGVWDTVSSVGFSPSTARHPCISMNYATKYFRHALALDESRIPFKPHTWGYPVPDALPEHDSYSPQFPESHEHDYTPPHRGYADVKEVWFAGCHADVGGGSHHDRVRNSLSNVSLRWMIAEVKEARCGIRFDYEATARTLVAPHPLADETADIYNQLVYSPWWWIPECLPFDTLYQMGNGRWIQLRWCNLGAGRFIPFISGKPVLVHNSVKRRIQHTDGAYKPAASNWDALMEFGMIEYVDDS